LTGDLAPTPRLRFVERDVPDNSAVSGTRRLRILQQLWQQDVPEYMRGNDGVWVDVPLEVE
jgi:hypothetical protein